MPTGAADRTGPARADRMERAPAGRREGRAGRPGPGPGRTGAGGAGAVGRTGTEPGAPAASGEPAGPRSSAQHASAAAVRAAAWARAGLRRTARAAGPGLRAVLRRRGRGCLGRRGEARGGGRCGCGRRLLLGDLAAEVLQKRVETAVESLADGGEAPDVLQVEVAEHHRALGGELRSGEGVPHHFLAARDDPDVPRTDLGHLPGTVERRGEGELLDGCRDAVERDAEGLGVTGLRTEELNGLLGRFRLIEEDEVPVVGELLMGVETEAADVESQPRGRDLHAYVQIRPWREITDLGLVAALEFPGHA